MLISLTASAPYSLQAKGPRWGVVRGRGGASHDCQVSDLRQSRRLVGGVAAQSRMALRAVIPRPPCCQRLGSSFVPCPPHGQPVCCDSTPQCDQHGSALRAQPLVLRMLHNPTLSLSLPGNIPGTVKLWESPGRAGGFLDDYESKNNDSHSVICGGVWSLQMESDELLCFTPEHLHPGRCSN